MGSVVRPARQFTTAAMSPALRRAFFAIALFAASGCVTIPAQVHSVIVDNQIVKEATNEVQINRAGVVVPVAPGAALEPGDVITTGPGSQTVLLLENGAVEVVLLENSEVRISSIWVEIGEVFVRVKKRLREKFEVESEYGVAGVESTEFIVRVRPDGAPPEEYRCVTLQGQVDVRSTSGTWSPLTVRAGEEVTGRSGTPPQLRQLDRKEYNSLVKRINDVERVYRPGAMQLLVPDVAGLMESDARRFLKEHGLGVGEVTGAVTGSAEIGAVVSQTPAAGQRIMPNDPVRLAVEAEPTTVPQVVGSQMTDAVRALAAERLKQGNVTEEITGERPQGEVLRQRPEAGERVPVDSAVDLWVEGASVRVPSVVNSNIETGGRLLTDSGLATGTVTDRLVEGVTDGTILEQSIAANEPVAPGTRIDLVVAARGIRVPILNDTTSAQASQILNRYGLKLGSVTIGTDQVTCRETVIAQSPRAGDLIRPGESVDITLSPACIVQ